MDGFFSRLDESPLSAVNARVAYRLIVLHFRRVPAAYLDPADGMQLLARELEEAGWGSLAMWVGAYAHHYRNEHTTTLRLREMFVARAAQGEADRRRGDPWASRRRACPRVTNRGAGTGTTRRADASRPERHDEQ